MVIKLQLPVYTWSRTGYLLESSPPPQADLNITIHVLTLIDSERFSSPFFLPFAETGSGVINGAICPAVDSEEN
jgi:hypothetical protein